MTERVQKIKSALNDLATNDRRKVQLKFFKTGVGQYGEGDRFIGITVPDQRKIVREFWADISLNELEDLLKSPIHEHRHSALLMLVKKYEKAIGHDQQTEIVDFYLKNKQFINNWDLVDTSCYKILGRYCYENKDDSILLNLSAEEDLWSKRIAVVSTMFHVKNGSFDLLKNLVIRNLNHHHDLMHKANGWLLREMGKKNEPALLTFLSRHYQKMPRTTLRYAIEKLPEDLRQDYLKGKI